MSQQKTLVCFHCGHSIPVIGIIGRREDCSKCGADLHVCKNCEFYDSKSYNECKEPQADRVVEKERGNFCDYFSPSQGGSSQDKSAALKAAAEALFKKN